MAFEQQRQQIIEWGRLISARALTAANSGNISWRVDPDKILITGHGSYLGFLEPREILGINNQGDLVDGKGKLTTELNLHLSIYNKFPEINCVVHVHAPHTTAFFHYYDQLESFSLESKLYLGQVKVIPQETPAVADVAPVIRAMETTKIVVLGNHGVVAMGESFKEAFGFIELLEEQARINLLLKTSNKFISKIENRESKIEETQTQEKLPGVDKYKMLSKEHRERLTQIVNDDSEVQELGRKYDLTCVLAVKNIQTNEAMRFVYQAGKITKVDDRDDAEFVIIAEPDMLRKVFNRQIDPFVAVTQGKVKTQGDFAKMSKWYPVMVKTFKLWEQAPVE